MFAWRSSEKRNSCNWVSTCFSLHLIYTMAVSIRNELFLLSHWICGWFYWIIIKVWIENKRKVQRKKKKRNHVWNTMSTTIGKWKGKQKKEETKESPIVACDIFKRFQTFTTKCYTDSTENVLDFIFLLLCCYKMNDNELWVKLIWAGVRHTTDQQIQCTWPNLSHSFTLFNRLIDRKRENIK